MSLTTAKVQNIIDARRARAEPKTIAGKPPPHDAAAESAIVVACIRRTSFDTADTIDRVAAIVGASAEAFFVKTNATIFETILELHGAGRAVDPLTLTSRLRELDRYTREVEEHLAALVNTHPAAIPRFVVQYAASVASKAKLRRWIYAAQEGATFAYGNVLDVDAFIRERTAELEEISRQAIAVKPTSTLAEAAGVLNAEVEQQVLAASLGVAPGLPTGIEALDAVTGGLHSTDVVMLSGPKKGFKSSAMISIGMHVASKSERFISTDGQEHSRRCGVGIFELEMTATKIAFNAAAQQSDLNRSRFRRHPGPAREDLEQLLRGQHEFEKLPIVIDPRTDTNVSNLRARIREVRFRCLVEFKCPLRLVMIDTLQLFALRPAHRPNEEQALVDAAMATVREVSLEPENARTAFLVTSQVNAEGEMRGSRAIEQHCNEWWHLEVKDDDGPMAKPSQRVARFIVKMGRDVERNDEIACAWVKASSGRFYT